ncbi:MAG: penicillin-binding protein activator [Alphaproteobacteria bacterium]|nr:penicillin-binding protein activator [Alphaproteobacteria bacterium]
MARPCRPCRAPWISSFALLAAVTLSLGACKTTPQSDTAGDAGGGDTIVVVEPEVIEPVFTEDSANFVADPITGINEPAYGDPNPSARRVALLLPLSGASSGLGHDLLDAATLALFDIGSTGIELVVADTQGTAEGAAMAAQLVLAADPDLIVGPLFSHSVSAAAPVARQAGINMIALSSDLAVAEPGVYVLGIAPEDQVERVVAHAANQGHLRFAVLAPQTRFGQRMVVAMEEAVARVGGTVTARAFYNPDGLGIDGSVKELTAYPARQADLEAQIAELRLRGDEVSLAAIERLQDEDAIGVMAFDALLVPESGSLLRQLSAYLGYYDVNPGQTRLLGLASWNDPTLIREPVMKGAWFASTPDTSRAWFTDRFIGAYDGDPTRLATLAYDAMALAAALTSSGAQGDFSERAITDWRGFSGVDGLFRFEDDGKPERGLAVMEISTTGVVVVDPAPTSFEPPAVSMLVSE